MESIQELSSFKRLMFRLSARKEWEASNNLRPLCACHGHTLTAAWNAALLEEHHRTTLRERAEALERAEGRRPIRLREAGVPEVHIAGLYRKLEPKPPLEATRRWLAQASLRERPFLLLLGTTATGKTQAAVYALAEFFRRHRWNEGATGTLSRPVGLFIRAVEFNELDAFSERGRDWLRDVRECRFLVVDDMGTERLSEVALGNLYSVVDARYGDMLPTVLTSNLKAQDWQQRFDERFNRRIRESGMVLRGEKLQVEPTAVLHQLPLEPAR